MANKKRNKNQNKQKANNRNKNQRNGSKSRQNSEQSISSSINSGSSKASKKESNGVTHKVEEQSLNLFGDCERRSDPSRAEKLLPIGDSTSKTIHSTNYSPKGLHNLGNTCYLNSVLQIISETHLLFDLLNERSNDGYVYRVKALINTNDWSPDRPFDEELDTILGQCFPLTQNLIGFMREMRANGSRTVSPSKLLNSIRKEWTQFDGWAQQDSHELLRCLLDSLKCKEVKRQRRAIITELKSRAETDPAVDDNNLDDDTKSRIKSYSTHSNITPIDAVFGGQLLSSVECEVCHNTSLKFEPFFDLSLPLTNFTNSYSNTNSVLIEKNDNKSNNKASNDSKPEEDDSPSNTDHKKTPKERRQLRQQKKAAKREVKLQKKAMNTIVIENKENSDNICDKNNENSGQELTEETTDWPEVNQWNKDGLKDGDKDKPEDSTVDQMNDCSPGLTDSQEIDKNRSEDWTNAWIKETKVWSDVQNEPDLGLEEPKNGSEEDLVIEPLLCDFDEKLCFRAETSDWDVNERPSQECTQGCNEEEEDDILNYIDMLYDNKDNKESEDVGWNDWGQEEWPTNDIQPFFGPELPPNEKIEVVDEESDEYKAQELEFQSSLDLETELLMSSISDGHKLEIKNSTNDPSNSSTDFDHNSETIKRIIALSLETISDNSSEKVPKFDLIRLLSNFTAIEWLSGNNKYFCEVCTKAKGEEKEKLFTNASKRALIALPPPVLTLHLKRFEADGYRRAISLKKISTYVSFPLAFDLSPFVSKMYNYLEPITRQTPVSALIYGLYGVVEHSGSLRSGHYTAYVKFRPNNRNQYKRFATFEPFLPKIENVLKMIENKFFTETNDNSNTNGFSSTANGGHSNGTTSDEPQTPSEAEEVKEEYSCSASDSGKWFHISDSSVTSSSLNAVLKSSAYILFYERIA